MVLDDFGKKVQSCPMCGNDMNLKRKKNGNGYVLSCMGYPNCRAAQWFPDAVVEAQVLDDLCDKCAPRNVHMIKFKFKRGSVPPYIPLQ